MNKKIIFVGIPKEPQKFGLFYCFNRRFTLYQCDLEGESLAELTSGQVESVRLPMHDELRNSIIFLGNSAGGSHFKAANLYQLSLSDNTIKMVIDSKTKRGDFPGLYVYQGPQIQIENGKIFLNTFYSLQKVVTMVDIDAKSCTQLNEGELEKSFKLFEVSNNVLLGVRSARNEVPKLVWG